MSLAIADRVSLARAEGPRPCEAFPVTARPMWSHLLDKDRCGAPDVALYLVGCVHEHIIEIWMCRDCLKPGDTRQYCGECYDSDGHVCDVAIRLAGGGS